MEANTLIVNLLDVPSASDIGEIIEELKKYFMQKQFVGYHSNEKPKIGMKFDGGVMYAVVNYKSHLAIETVLSQSDHNILVDGQTIDLDVHESDGYAHSRRGGMGGSSPAHSLKSDADHEAWEKVCFEAEDEDDNDEDASATVLVTNYQDTNQETLRLYFENKRRSGGGEIANVNVDHEGNLTITFSEVKDAEAVVTKRNHMLEGNTLTVVPVKKKKPRPWRPKDGNSLFLQGIADDVSNDMLLLYLENCTQKEEDPEIVYGEDPGTAMVTYSSKIEDIEMAIERFKKKKICKQRISASCVYVPDCILITNLKPGTSLDNIELYFENERRSGGGLVREVKFNEGDDQAIVFFEDWKVVDRVLQQQHKVSGTPISVSKHLECMGTDISTESPTPKLPKEFSFQVDRYLAAYLLNDGSPHKAKLVQAMGKEGAEVVWPQDGKEDTLTVRPNPGKGIAIDSRHWKDLTCQILTKAFNEFTTCEVVVKQPFWEEVCRMFDGLTMNKVHPLHSPEGSRILLRGPKEDVTYCKAELQRIQEDLEKAAEIEKQRTRKGMKVSPEKFKVFVLCRIKESVSQEFETLNISTDSGSHQILLEGLKSDISEAQAAIYAQFDALIEQRIGISPNKAGFILHVEDKIHEIFSSCKISAACQVNEQEVVVIGATQQDVNRAATFIKDDLVDESVSFQDKDIFQTQKGIALLEKINKEKSVLTTLNDRSHHVEISGFKSDVEKHSAKIREFLNENAEMSHFIPLQKGKLRFLDQHERDTIRGIGQHQQASVDIQVDTNGPNRGIKVTGTEQGLQNVIPQLTALTDGILERQHPITKPGIQDLLSQANGKHFMEKVQRDCQCVVESGDTDEDIDHTQNQMRVSRPHAQVLTSHAAPNGCQLKVCKGDLTTERVDAIINAANTDLRHVGGLARAIIEEGGDSIQRESKAILQQKGRSLYTSEAVVTGPGNLPCQHIIHVAGPIWPRGLRGSRQPSRSSEMKTKEEDLLYDTTKNVLTEANQRKLTSISIPAISSGIYGFPLDLCAQTIVEAVLEVCDGQKRTSLREIRFTNNDQRSTDAFLDVFQRRFGNRRQSGTTELPIGARVDHPNVHSTSSDVLTTAEGIRVNLVKGNIAHEKVDVIVNTVGSSVQLTQGGVSTAIQSVAGPSLQKECNAVLRQKNLTKLPTGEFIVTGAGKLSCKEVFHIVCDNYSGPKSEQILSTLMQTVLNQAETSGYTSIAIPAIGTGNLRFPHKVTAQLMYEEALTFSQQKSNGSLKDIRFVIYQQDDATIQAFETEVKSIRGQGPSFQRRSSKNLKPQRRLKTQSGNDFAMPSGDNIPASEKTRVKIGSVIVELQQGDITRETTDIIVNSVGHNLGLLGPVSQAILRAGGNEIKRECEQVQARSGGDYYDVDVFKTTAGRLPCKSIIHVATPHSAHKLRDVVGRALQLADQEKAMSIAFPALGTGVVSIGDDTEAVATALLEAIGEFVVQDKPSYLRLVKITIFKPEMAAKYENAMKSKVDRASGKQSKGMLRKGLAYVWSALSGASSNETEESWERPSDDTLILHIFAKSSYKLDQAIDKIEGFIKTEFYCEEIPVEADLISEIDDEKMRRIYAIGETHKVEIIPMLEGRAKQISIQGRETAVRATKSDLLAYFMELHREKTRRAEDQLINKEVQWKYKDSSGIFVEYGDEINPLIEREHRDGRPYARVDLEEGGIMIDFETMEETGKGHGASSSPVDVHRCDIKNENTFTVPSNWGSMNPGVQHTTVTLPQGTEMNEVQTQFQKVVGRQVTITKIERIQILDLYRQHAAIKERMQSSIPRGGQVPIERTLYQGVDHSITQKINSSGFDRADNTYQIQYIGNIGMGIYFSSNATWLDQYVAASGPQSRKYMYVCKVLTGLLEQGRTGMISPSQNPNSPGNSYDCAVDNVQTPTYFVVFKDGQAYPEYLIEYQ